MQRRDFCQALLLLLCWKEFLLGSVSHCVLALNFARELVSLYRRRPLRTMFYHPKLGRDARIAAKISDFITGRRLPGHGLYLSGMGIGPLASSACQPLRRPSGLGVIRREF
jgi:rRNA maturation protein Rpf1